MSKAFSNSETNFLMHRGDPGIAVMQALSASDIGVWQWDIDADQIRVSETLVDLIDIVSREQLGFTEFLELVHEADRDTFKRAINNSIRKNRNHRVVFRALAPDGDYHWFVSKGVVHREEDSNRQYLLATIQDIDYEKTAVEALRESERRYRSAVNDQADFIVRWLPSGIRTFVNDSYCEYFGKTREQLVGTSFFPLIAPEDQERIREKVESLTPRNPVASAEHRSITPSGEVRWHHWTDRAFFDDDGNIVEFHSVGRDITESKQLEETLKESKANLDKAQEVSKIGSWSWDLKTGEIGWSDQMYKIYGINKDEIPDSAWNVIDQLTHPEDREHVRQSTERAMKDNTNTSVEYRIIHPNGEIRYVLGEGDLFFDENGEPAMRVGTVQDITERKMAEEALRQSEERFQLAVQGSSDGFWDWPDTGKDEVWVSPRFYTLLGYKDKEFPIGFKKFTEMLHPDDRAPTTAAVQAHLQKRQPYDVEYRLRAKSGDYIWFHARGQALWDADGKPLRMSGSIQDITERKLAEEKLRASEEKFSKAFRSSPDSYTISHQEDGRIIEVNEGFERMLGYQQEEVIGKTSLSLDIWVFPEERKKLIETLQQEGHIRDMEVCLRTRAGERRLCLLSAEPMVVDGEPCMTAVIRDITERKAYVANMEYQATHDSLTGLPNRELLFTYTRDALDRATKNEKKAALLLMDLDRFKEINDTLGHQSGDKLLKQIGPRLQQHLDPDTTLITRLGGDEFAIVISDIDDEQQAIGYVENILEEFKEPFDIGGLSVEIGASIGISLFPEHGDSHSKLLRCADVAMYHAKHRAFGYAFYSPEDDKHTLRRLALITDLGPAIRSDQLYLHYQPKVDLGSNSVIGFEALLRWNHPTHGHISPEQFIPIAETGDLISPLTYWVVDNALQQLCVWHRQARLVNVSVNVSTRNLLDEEFPKRIEELIKKNGANPRYLELEITESAIMADPDRALHTLTRLSKIGVQLSIDDFGTGYSSLSYLKSLPIQLLKIDLSFVRQMTESNHDRMIVQSTIGLAHNLELRVIAEGVEDKATMKALKDFDCDFAQGHYFSPPMDQGGIEDWLASSQAKQQN